MTTAFLSKQIDDVARGLDALTGDVAELRRDMNARFEANERHHDTQDRLMVKMMQTLEQHTEQLGRHEEYFHQVFTRLDYHSDLLSEIKTDVRSINVKLDVHEKIFLANPNLYEGKVRFPAALAMKKAATV